MKSVIVPLVFLGAAACTSKSSEGTVNNSSRSTPETRKTVITCDQEDGDRWKSIGIIRDSRGKLQMWVVENNTDTQKKTLVHSPAIEEPFFAGDNGTGMYADSSDSYKLTVVKKAGQNGGDERLVGEYVGPARAGTVAADGSSKAEVLEDLNCREKDSIEITHTNLLDVVLPMPNPEVPTLLMCFQDEGDERKSVGIVNDGANLKARVVQASEMDELKELPSHAEINRRLSPNGNDIYSNRSTSFVLTTTEVEGTISATLKLNANGNYAETLTDLTCLKNAPLTLPASSRARAR